MTINDTVSASPCTLWEHNGTLFQIYISTQWKFWRLQALFPLIILISPQLIQVDMKARNFVVYKLTNLVFYRDNVVFFIIFGTLNTRSSWYCKEKVYFERFSYVSNTMLRVENSRNKRFKKASEIYISLFFPTLIISLSSFILIELLQNRSVLIISSVTSPPILVLYTIFSAYAAVLCFSEIVGWWDFFPSQYSYNLHELHGFNF